MKTSFIMQVFLPSVIFIAVLVLFAVFAPEFSNSLLESAKGFVFGNFSWFFIISVSFFVAFMMLLALSKFGDIRLGLDHEKPALPFLSWLAMLFATGMGVGLMYFGVAEPIIHKMSLKSGDDEAMLHTIFHWGVHPWAIYGICALSMAYFGFRYQMPLSLRSAFYPFLKDKISGNLGHIVDILALIVTVFGISTTLGYSASQLGAGLNKLGFISKASFSEQTIIIIIITAIATISAISKKGLRRLSELNLILALMLMIFVLFAGDFVRILSSFSSNLGLYLSNILNLSFKTYIYESEKITWFNNWTIYYWAWWLSWAPFVGFFIAKISRGRTIREFIFGVLIVPTLFNILWFSIFGNSALGYSERLAGFAPERLLFEFLELLPLSHITPIVALIVLALFFITSADSSIFVLNSLASGGKEKSITWQSVFWGLMLVAISCVLLRSGGLGAILNVTMLVALPFALMLVLMCFSLLKGLKVDENYFKTDLSEASVFYSGNFWQQRLERILKQPNKGEAKEFLHKFVRPAMQKIAAKLRANGLKAYIIKEQNSLKLVVKKGNLKDFIYGVRLAKHEVNPTLLEDDYLPTHTSSKVFLPLTFFGDNRLGYDIKHLSVNEIIADILKQYERYLSLIDDKTNEIFTSEI